MLFFLNAAIDYALLLCTAKICGAFPKRRFLLLGALLGGAYAAAAVFIPPLSSLPAEALCGILMAFLAFGPGRAFPKIALVFLAVSAAFGGAAYSVSLLGGGGGALSPRALTVSFAICYAVFSLVFRRLGRAETLSLTSEIVLTLGSRSLTLKALRDTGNTLSDPAGGAPLIILERSCAAKLLPPEQAEVFSEKYADAAETVLAAEKRGLFLRLVPYRAVGTASGLLPVFRLDGAVIDGKKYDGALAAVSPTPLSDGGGFRALIGGQT